MCPGHFFGKYCVPVVENGAFYTIYHQNISYFLGLINKLVVLVDSSVTSITGTEMSSRLARTSSECSP